MTEFLDIAGGPRIAYDVAGEGPLVVLSHGIGDHRQVFRFLAPELVAAGFRVAAADMRGHGESSMGDWKSISRTEVAGDLVALVRHLGGGPAVIVGNSLSGGAATIAAATAPDLVSGIIEIGPFTRTVQYSLGGIVRIRRYRRGTLAMTGVMMLHSLRSWMRYLDVAYPQKPADYAAYTAALRAKLSEPGRMGEFLKTMNNSPADAGDALPRISCPALIVMGTEDPDWADPRAEAEGIVAAMPAGLGRIAMISGAGHYPHAQCPDEVARLIMGFFRERVLP
jgi:pimeloyl-ACP methyl ester carboxylesterase